MKRAWRRNWIVAAAVVVHAIWGIVLLWSPAPLHTTPLGAIHAIPLFQNRWIAAAIYIGASVIASIPVVRPQLDTRFVGLMTAIPQQFLLMVSFFTAVLAIFRGQYPDGYVPDAYGSPRMFIFVDQLWPMVGMVSHSLSLIDWYWWSRVPENRQKP